MRTPPTAVSVCPSPDCHPPAPPDLLISAASLSDADVQPHVLAALRAGGGYAAITQLLHQEELDPVSPEGQLLRDVLLQGLGLVGLAYEFNPFRLPEQGLQDLLSLLAALLDGECGDLVCGSYVSQTASKDIYM